LSDRLWVEKKRPPGLYRGLAMSIAIGLVLGAMLLVATWDADPDEPLPNEVHFHISCSDRSQTQFDHATSLLHSLRYAYSERIYASIAGDEPGCVMAYWGIAMSRLKRPIAAPPSAEDIRAAMEALAAATKARTASHRERAYVAAVSALVAEGAPADWHSRTLAYEKAMEAIARQYPEDRETRIFYALALNMATLASDKSYAKQTKATELLLVALSEQPDHPGIAHYLTYCLSNASSTAPDTTLLQSVGMTSQTRRTLLSGLAVLLVFGVGGLAVLGPAWAEDATSPAPIGGPFTLSSGNGRMVSDQEFRGKWLLVYFGYTHCPDVCPTTLLEIVQTLEQLGPLAAEVQPIFITIDPERDTPEAVSEYLEAFDPRIVGLSGTPAEISNVAKEYRVYYKKQERVWKDSEDYLMEHSAFVYVIGPSGTYVTLFSPLQGQGPDQMALRLRELIMRTSR
jgi:cytochrome oxidase Cu insertion factor (SCO1/SenC/PrrC family)